MDTITLTFGDVCENHTGMQKIGKLSDAFFTTEDMKSIQELFHKNNCKTELHRLNDLINVYVGDEASMLIIRNGLNLFLDPNELYNEHIKLDFDKKVYSYGKVVNKRARYNLCFADYSQEPDYINKMGRIISFNDVNCTKFIRDNLHLYFGDKAKNLMLEGNYYYDINKCGIGWHGDAERRKVIGIRLGKTMPLAFQWYINRKPIGEKLILNLNHGDMYVLGEKSSGHDWKKYIIPTIRHSAGINFI